MDESQWLAPRQRENLRTVREQIDDLDAKIASLLNERLKLARKAGLAKALMGMSVCDGEREAIVLDRASREGADDQLSQSILRIYQALLDESRSVQDANPLQAGRGANLPAKQRRNRSLINTAHQRA